MPPRIREVTVFTPKNKGTTPHQVFKLQKSTCEAQTRILPSNPTNGCSTPIPETIPGLVRSKRKTNEDQKKPNEDQKPAAKKLCTSNLDVVRLFRSEDPPRWLSDTIDPIKEDIKTTWNDQNDLRTEHDELLTEHNELRTKHNELQTEHYQLLGKHGTLNQNVKEISARFEAEILLHGKQIEDLRSNFQILLDAEEIRRTELNKVREDLAEEATRHSATNQKVGELETTSSAEATRFNEADKRTANLSAEVTRLNAKVAELEAKLTDEVIQNDAKISKLKTKDIALEIRIATLTKCADGLENTDGSVRNSLDTLTGTVQRGEKEIDNVKKRIEKIENDVSSAMESIPAQVTQMVALQGLTLSVEVAISVLSHLATQDLKYEGIIKELRIKLATATDQTALLECQKRCEEHTQNLFQDRKRQHHTLVERVGNVENRCGTLIERIEKGDEDREIFKGQIQNSSMGIEVKVTDWLNSFEETLRHIKADISDVQIERDALLERQKASEEGTQTSLLTITDRLNTTVTTGPKSGDNMLRHDLEILKCSLDRLDIAAKNDRRNRDLAQRAMMIRQKSCEQAHAAMQAKQTGCENAQAAIEAKQKIYENAQPTTDTRQKSCEDTQAALIKDTLPKLAKKTDCDMYRSNLTTFINNLITEKVLQHEATLLHNLNNSLGAVHVNILSVRNECITTCNKSQDTLKQEFKEILANKKFTITAQSEQDESLPRHPPQPERLLIQAFPPPQIPNRIPTAPPQHHHYYQQQHPQPMS